MFSLFLFLYFRDSVLFCFLALFLYLLIIFSYIVDYYIYKALKEQEKE